MMSESDSKTLDGLQVWQLRENYGLEETVVKDLASEVKLNIDWEDFERVYQEKKAYENQQFKENEDALLPLVKVLQDTGVKVSDDSFKYNYSTSKTDFGVKSIEATIVGIVLGKQLVSEAMEGSQCLLVTDKTNFYSEGGGQISDIGKIYNKDFTFQVEDVLLSKGYIFHKGAILSGTVKHGCLTQMCVDEEHRLSCSQNHTATHLLNSFLKKILPYTAQRSSYVGPKNLRFGFSSKSALTSEQVEEIEETINRQIQQQKRVNRIEMPFQELLDNPNAIIMRGEEYPEYVHVISVNSAENEEILSLEPCCGTHVQNTSDIELFIVVPSKSHGGSTRYINAVTGKQASVIKKNGEEISDKVLQLKIKVDKVSIVSEEKLTALLKEVKQALRECQVKQDAPLVTLKKCERILHDLKLKLEDMLRSCSTNEEIVSESLAEPDRIESKVSADVIQLLLSKNVPTTNDDHKYNWQNKGAMCIDAKLLAVIRDNKFAESVNRGLNCQLVLNETNFYAEEDDQASDVGLIHCQDFVFKVINVYKVNGFVFHDGIVEQGNVTSNKTVQSVIDEGHRLSCSQNHTALHLLNAALKEELPYSYQHFAHAGAKDLLLTFSCKVTLSDSQLQNLETKINETIEQNLNVSKSLIPVDSSSQFPPYKLSIVKKSKDTVPTISVGNDRKESLLKSVEPCYGTHVNSTSQIGLFVITSSKSKSNKEKVIRAVTGNQAQIVRKDGEMYEKEMIHLEEYVSSCLQKENLDYLELWDCLKEIKKAKVYHETDLPLLLFRKHQNILTELSKKLITATDDFVQQGFKEVALEMKKVLKENSDKSCIIYKLESVGDGKKIINFALENSENKPAMYFAKDGHKSVICSCSVPKHLVKPTFSALLWINPVACFLEGRARTSTKDPELFYSVICPKPDNLDKAFEIAKQFIESNLNLNKS